VTGYSAVPSNSTCRPAEAGAVSGNCYDTAT
jgi:hypothetical protein